MISIIISEVISIIISEAVFCSFLITPQWFPLDNLVSFTCKKAAGVILEIADIMR